MTTWEWKCLALMGGEDEDSPVHECGETGTGDDYDAVIADAAAHNEMVGHAQPSMSYSNDEPEVEPAPPPPTAIDLFDQTADAIAKASSVDDIKTAFAQLKDDIAPFVTPPAEVAKG